MSNHENLFMTDKTGARQPMPATIRDVARAAGVSVATVSRALNGADNVLPDTRRRILDAARELRFTPSGAARSLITRRTDTIGALLPDLYGEYFSELIRGIDQAARARGLHLLVSSSHGNASEAAAALRAMNGRVDGLLVMTPHADADFLALNLPGSLPVVLVNTGMDLPGRTRFAIDNFGGAQAMTRHLATAGHKRVAFIGGPEGNEESLERLRGYRAGLRPAARETILAGDFNEESGWAAGRRIAQMRPRPDAVFAANDMMAIGCLAALSDAGLRVPEDIAVAGFDDIPIARYVTPALTTIRVPIAALGAAALDALAKTVEAPQEHSGQIAVMPVELVVRRSCGAGPPLRPEPPAPRMPPTPPLPGA
jgi:LacI family transcriptional regulator